METVAPLQNSARPVIGGRLMTRVTRAASVRIQQLRCAQLARSSVTGIAECILHIMTLRGCHRGIKYTVFIFNFVFWVKSIVFVSAYTHYAQTTYWCTIRLTSDVA